MMARELSRCSDSGRGIWHDSGTLTNVRLLNASAHFLNRAKYYRFAAARTRNPRETERLCDVALMFERMAHDVRRLRPVNPDFPGRMAPKEQIGRLSAIAGCGLRAS